MFGDGLLTIRATLQCRDPIWCVAVGQQTSLTVCPTSCVYCALTSAASSSLDVGSRFGVAVNANVTVKFVINEKGNLPGKLADAELHFTDGVLAGT